VEWDRRLVAAHQAAESVRTTGGAEERVEAGWLVGCDGAHSMVRCR
jgi:4,5-epoxidase